MKCLIQRVKCAEVAVKKETIAQIKAGILIFLAVEKDDTVEQAEKLAQKIIQLRIFNDQNNKPNLNIIQTQNSILVVSQFTLAGSTKKGNRPSFVGAEHPEKAIKIYDHFCAFIQSNVTDTQKGMFGAHMDVHLINDGPYTLWLEA